MFILRGAVTVCLFLANLAFSQYLSGLVRRAGAQKNRHAQHRADAQSRVPRTAQRLRCRLDHDTRVKIPVENRLASLETGIHFGNGHTKAFWSTSQKKQLGKYLHKHAVKTMQHSLAHQGKYNVNTLLQYHYNPTCPMPSAKASHRLNHYFSFFLSFFLSFTNLPVPCQV